MRRMSKARNDSFRVSERISARATVTHTSIPLTSVLTVGVGFANPSFVRFSHHTYA